MKWTPLTPLKKLSTGYFRLAIVGWLAVTILSGFIFKENVRDDGEILGGIVFTALGYYVAVLLVIWISDGFRHPDKNL